MQLKLSNLIFDRTQQDLDNDTDKAYIDCNDLNRIEQACSYLASVLGINIQIKTWTMKDYRTEAEMQRLRDNIYLLKNVYNESHYPELGKTIQYASIREANDVERILHDIEVTYQTVISSLRRFSFSIGRKPLGNRR